MKNVNPSLKFSALSASAILLCLAFNPLAHAATKKETQTAAHKTHYVSKVKGTKGKPKVIQVKASKKGMVNKAAKNK
jgi:hypothetical protein